MRLVIDLQGAQASSRFRGIGRYSLSLSLALINNRNEHEVFIALNGLFPETIDDLKAAFNGLLPPECVRVWSAPGPINATDPQHETRRHVAELLYEQFLASMSPDIVLVTSLFEGLGDNAATSIRTFAGIPTAVILYDLIPLIYSKIYLENPVVGHWYRNKIAHLQNADLLLSISESSGQEAIEYLGFDQQRVCNISTAADDHLQPAAVTDEELSYLAKQYGLLRPFVMYIGGIDHRKNIETLIAAYAELPVDLRKNHQLAVICSIQQFDKERLLNLAAEAGLFKDELILTGYVPEEDLLTCYRSCKFFVFPSWHEGFGLPVLEAMQCGRAVIASNASSLPEVIGRNDALFDPYDTNSIAQKMKQLLIDDTFREELEYHGLEQARKFSWNNSASRAWQALENVSELKRIVVSDPPNRPRLAYFSPLPPEASGISDYSEELLPALSKHYQIELIVVNPEHIAHTWAGTHFPVRDVAWFRQHAQDFQRILYQFGNSHFHSHMFSLLHDYPGVVVLHDFFLSGVAFHRDVNGETPQGWAKALLESHGWPALFARFEAKDLNDVIMTYPCNLQVLQDALGIIVHSEHSRQLARKWYGNNSADKWSVLPLIRNRAKVINRTAARLALDVAEDDFIVCSFGFMAPSKLNHRLLAAWLMSPLSQDPRCHLVFVGQNYGGDYGSNLTSCISQSLNGSRIKITGWADSSVFHEWLEAADVGVQLRTLSRGETSRAVMDCMSYGLATIVNANGSMAELNKDAVWMLPDNFEDSQLIEALTVMWLDKKRRNEIGHKARQVITEQHDPARCAALYAKSIEAYYHESSVGLSGLLSAISVHATALDLSEWHVLASCAAKNIPASPRCKKLFIDITELLQDAIYTGVRRVASSVLDSLLHNPPQDGWQVEPVYATMDNEGYRYARRFTYSFLGVVENLGGDDIVDICDGDIFLGLGFQPQVIVKQNKVLQAWHQRGVIIKFLVYNLLPILRPEFFVERDKEECECWLKTAAQFDGLICVSRASVDELQAWLKENYPNRQRPFSVQSFYLGANLENSMFITGMPANAAQVLSTLEARPSFLSIGTIEPRKGHAQVLSAFESLWAKGVDVNLVFIGKQGWMVEPLIEQLKTHVELDKRFFWLENVSDEYLEAIYAASDCLIAASHAAGFGLPLIEAARHKLPIIARDIPIFREISKQYTYFFDDLSDPQVIFTSINEWLKLNAVGNSPQSWKIPWLNWTQSTQQLIENVLYKN